MYKIQSIDGNHVVNLSNKEYSYRLWQVIGMSCKHVVIVVQQSKEQSKKCLHPYYGKDAYLATYFEIIELILGKALWKKNGREFVLPLYVLRLLGKLKSKKEKIYR